ncbi:hypothetical protein N9W79_00660 [bacterium]|nr:hypothetical protein [bacterium]
MKRKLLTLCFLAGAAFTYQGCGEIPGVTEEDSEESSADDGSDFEEDQSASDFQEPVDVPELSAADLPDAMEDAIKDAFETEGGGDDDSSLALQEEECTGDDCGSDDEGGGPDPFDCMEDVVLSAGDGFISMDGHVDATTCFSEQFNDEENPDESFDVSDAIVRFSFRLECDFDFSSRDGETLGSQMGEEGSDPMDDCTGTEYGFYQQMSMEVTGTMTDEGESHKVDFKVVKATNNGFDTVCEWNVSEGTESLDSSCTFVSGEHVLVDGEIPTDLTLNDDDCSDDCGDGPDNRFFKATSDDLEAMDGYELYTGGSATFELNNWDGNIAFNGATVDWTAGDESGSVSNYDNSSSLNLIKPTKSLFGVLKQKVKLKKLK